MIRSRAMLVAPLIGAMLCMVFLSGCASCGCGPTPESEKARFKQNIDTLELKSSKYPQFQIQIEKKVAEFKGEFEAAGTDMKKLRALNTRVEDYVAKIEKEIKSNPGGNLGTGAARPVGGKLNGGVGNTAPPVRNNLGGGGMAPATGGKLGGGGGMAPATGGKLGGGGGMAPQGGNLGGGGVAPQGGKLGGGAGNNQGLGGK